MEPGCRHHTPPARGGAGAFFSPAPVANSVQRVPAPAPKRVIKYTTAKKYNQAYSAENSLGWATKLETINGGIYKPWWTQWQAANYNDFADLVYDYQDKNGIGDKPDGVLGLTTWTHMTNLGEAVAGIEKVNTLGDKLCYEASKYRLEKGYEAKAGEKLSFEAGKSEDTYEIIMKSAIGKMADVPLEYRGTGAAGAAVYAGVGTFVSEADIWAGKLQPGAMIQVWQETNAYDKLREAEVTAADGKTRRINDSDANYFGTSYVFVRYGSTFEEMHLRHFGRVDQVHKSEYEKWIAANVDLPAAATPAIATPAATPAAAPVAEP